MCLSDEEHRAGRGVGRSVADGGREPIDRILLTLSEPRCRYLLYYLDERENAYIEDAARFVAACDRDGDASELPENHVERVKQDLYHVHLPKLTQTHIIEYDQRSGAMRFQDPPEDLSSFLDLASTVELPKSEIEEL